jgi:soluble lytic murein transglycosylase-like protein
MNRLPSHVGGSNGRSPAIRRVIGLFVAVASWLALPSSSRAQIASYVDEHGKVVYVNGDSPKTHSRSTISSPSAFSTPSAAQSAPASNQPASPPNEQIEQIVRAAAERHNVDPALVKAVISTESGWNPRAVSPKGAVGLMQLIPETAQRFGVGNSFDPAQNVEGGTSYLKSLLDRYNGDLTKSLAAYNAGERAVDQSGGVPAYRETQRYVQKVTDTYFRPGSGRDSSLWAPPRAPVRQELDSNGHVVFTNE